VSIANPNITSCLTIVGVHFIHPNELTGEIVSGHSLKHLLAAAALLVVYRMLRRRAPRSPDGDARE